MSTSRWRRLAEGPVDLLCSETDATCVVPETRWNADRYHDPNPAKVGKMVTRRGGFLREIDQFDPQFFGMSPREAHSARSAAAPPAARHVGGARRRRNTRRRVGGHRRRGVHRRLHPRLPTAAEPGPHQSLSIQDPFRHRHDDDDAGEPHLVRLRLPRAEHDDRHGVLRARSSRSTLRRRASGTASATSPSPAA